MTGLAILPNRPNSALHYLMPSKEAEVYEANRLKDLQSWSLRQIVGGWDDRRVLIEVTRLRGYYGLKGGSVQPTRLTRTKPRTFHLHQLVCFEHLTSSALKALCFFRGPGLPLTSPLALFWSQFLHDCCLASLWAYSSTTIYYSVNANVRRPEPTYLYYTPIAGF
ncbi:hypothetical protein K505DRAFT_343900 [Melanomma pulvis-pyrius CBS 109.77]|uniref:Uncharacterized protein n=1 Tax=Melanomma pulvis-pyrius CBS 109.77 TaxID=1314802 RepID=A0A6A6WQG3_9PLEO|nr:hypothetical protein K505DRAFT_343900 [Melanomma pulvis-pyrius CBS 109.77]